VQCRRACTGQAKYHEGALDRLLRLGRVTGVPLFNAETPAESGDLNCFDPVDESAVPIDIRLDRLDQPAQAVLPVTRPEIRQPSSISGTLEELVDHYAHGLDSRRFVTARVYTQ
jgi:hypothetical protein